MRRPACQGGWRSARLAAHRRRKRWELSGPQPERADCVSACEGRARKAASVDRPSEPCVWPRSRACAPRLTCVATLGLETRRRAAAASHGAKRRDAEPLVLTPPAGADHGGGSKFSLSAPSQVSPATKSACRVGDGRRRTDHTETRLLTQRAPYQRRPEAPPGAVALSKQRKLVLLACCWEAALRSGDSFAAAMAKPLSLLVAVKRCVDYATKIRVLPDRSVRACGSAARGVAAGVVSSPDRRRACCRALTSKASSSR